MTPDPTPSEPERTQTMHGDDRPEGWRDKSPAERIREMLLAYDRFVYYDDAVRAGITDALADLDALTTALAAANDLETKLRRSLDIYAGERDAAVAQRDALQARLDRVREWRDRMPYLGSMTAPDLERAEADLRAILDEGATEPEGGE